MDKFKEIRESINKDISAIIRDEFKYSKYAVNLKDSSVSFTDILIKMKELKHSLIQLDKELTK